MGGGQEMDIHPSETSSPERAFPQKSKHLAIFGKRCARQREQEPENDVSLGERSAGKFADDERMAEHAVSVEDRHERR